MSLLPVAEIASELCEVLTHSDVILSAPPGAGKSTYLPLALLKAPHFANKKLVMLQPRRVAVRSIAARLAAQLGEKVGETVGYRIRGEQQVGPNTRLEILTEGLLTRRLQSDPELSEIALVIFDEFHERNLHGDLALAFALESQQALRDDLRLLVMSATLEQKGLQSLLPQARVMQSQGRTFPVEQRYQSVDGKAPLVPQVASVIKQALAAEQGSILVFLPGSGEIRRLAETLDGSLPGDVRLYPLYGDLDKEMQMAAIAPAADGERKLVLATNIAETSLTIDGIRVVIDSGLERSAWFDPKRGLTKLRQQKISQASATQRAGRAGRTGPGVCIRLWAEELHHRLDPHTTPEMLRSDMSQPLLEAAQWGTPMSDLALLDLPSQAQLQVGDDLLRRFEAISDNGQITEHGRLLCQSGTHPRFANMLTSAKHIAELLDEDADAMVWMACLAAAILEGDSRRGDSPDLEVRIEQLRKQPSGLLMRQAKQWAKRFGVKPTDALPTPALGLVVATGFPDRIGKGNGKGRYQLSGGSGAALAADDSLSTTPWLVAAGLFVSDFQQGDAAITGATPVDIEQLLDLFPDWQEQTALCRWLGDKLDVRRVIKLGAIELSSEAMPAPDEATLSQLWRDEITNRGIGSLPFSDSAKAYLHRARLAQSLLSEQAPWPDLSDAGLLQRLDQWCLPLVSSLQSWSALKGLDWLNMLKGFIPWECQQLIQEALPTHYTLPTGRNAKLNYDGDNQVKLSVKLQELFGLAEHPSVANGRFPVLVEMLSPAQRPIQLTKDLPGFWQGSYQEVKKEMKGRYPKHPWPDDPANAIATHKTKNALAREQRS